jgi:hypothetical protein
MEGYLSIYKENADVCRAWEAAAGAASAAGALRGISPTIAAAAIDSCQHNMAYAELYLRAYCKDFTHFTKLKNAVIAMTIGSAEGAYDDLLKNILYERSLQIIKHMPESSRLRHIHLSLAKKGKDPSDAYFLLGGQ